MRATARFTEADLVSAIKDARARGGNWCVEIPPGPTPEIRVVMSEPSNENAPLIPSIPKVPTDNGWVYFIRAVQTGRIKIGFSLDPSRRLRELEFGCPEDLELITQIPGSFFRERGLHKRFAVHRARGEWFEPAPELLDYIKEIVRR